MKKSILNNSIEKINKEFPNQWSATIDLIKELSSQKDIDITIYNPIQGKSLFLENEEIEYAIEYINQELNQAKDEGYYSEMNLAIIIHQKSKIFSSIGVRKHRVGMCSALNEGIFSVEKEKLEFVIPVITRRVDTAKAVFYDFNYILKLLKIKQI